MLIHLLYLFILIGPAYFEAVVESDAGIFFEHDEVIVQVHEKDDIESKPFEMAFSALDISCPAALKNVNDKDLQAEIEKQCNESLKVENSELFDYLQDICFEEPSIRVKRIDPISAGLVVAGVVVGVAIGSGTFIIIKYGDQIETLQAQNKELRKNLEGVIQLLNNVSKASEQQKFAFDVQSSLTNYIRQQKRIVRQFIKLLKEKKMLQIKDLPVEFRTSFGNGSNTENFYFIKLNKCTAGGIQVEITVMSGSKSKELKCHKYSHAGTFENRVYHTYILPDLVCYDGEGACYSVDVDFCLKQYNSLKCTSTAIKRCTCEPQNIRKCPVKSEFATQNFIKIQEYGNIVLLATTTETYTIVQGGIKSTSLMPPSGILYVNLHEKDSLEIGTVQLHGSSSNVTFIAHIVPDTYTLPPPPQWSTVSYTESISGHVNSHFFEYLYATALIVILCLFCCLLTVLYKSNK